MLKLWPAYALACCACCGGPPADTGARPPASRDATGGPGAPATGLVAHFDTRSASFAGAAEASLAFVVENRGPAPEQIDLDVLGSPIFGLDVFDAGGRRVPTVPPGVPPENYQPPLETLAPGASRRFVHALNVFSPPLPPGKYTARVRAAGLRSETARFEIR